MNRGKQPQMAKDAGTSRTEMSWTSLKETGREEECKIRSLSQFLFPKTRSSCH